jgi:hypothetical protein
MRLAHQLAEDRALRDAALALFKADLRFIRDDLDHRGIGERVADRLGDGAKEFIDDAVDYAGDHKSVVTAAIAAVVLWFARAPILHALGELFDSDDDEAGDVEQEAPDRRSSRRSKKSSEAMRDR